jgi:SseB protein C-terminal domain/SseB protein N-terminal domain
MFEPENEIERMLVRASTQPSERRSFMRALLDSEIFVVLVPEGGHVVPGPEGNATIPQGTKLNMPSAMRGEERLVPFFTRPSRARAWFKGDHIVAPEIARDLFTRYPDASFLLNPGSDYGKEFVTAEVKRLLSGEFGEGVDEITIPQGQQLLLGHPSEIPTKLIAALAREFAKTPAVRGAWLMLAMRAGQTEQSWMLGVDHKGSWQSVLDAITRAVSGNILNGRMLDAMPLDASDTSVTLRGGIPIIAATQKRGFLQKLFR